MTRGYTHKLEIPEYKHFLLTEQANLEIVGQNWGF